MKIAVIGAGNGGLNKELEMELNVLMIFYILMLLFLMDIFIKEEDILLNIIIFILQD